MESISGITFRAVEVAAKELERCGLKIERYQILVRSVEESIFVSRQESQARPTRQQLRPDWL